MSITEFRKPLLKAFVRKILIRAGSSPEVRSVDAWRMSTNRRGESQALKNKTSKLPSPAGCTAALVEYCVAIASEGARQAAPRTVPLTKAFAFATAAPCGGLLHHKGARHSARSWLAWVDQAGPLDLGGA